MPRLNRLRQASAKGVALVAVPAFGVMADFIAPMEAAVRSFLDLTETIGIHMPEVVFVADGGQKSMP